MRSLTEIKIFSELTTRRVLFINEKHVFKDGFKILGWMEKKEKNVGHEKFQKQELYILQYSRSDWRPSGSSEREYIFYAK